MPYIRSNWDGLTQFNGGGKFEIGQVHTVDSVKLARPGGKSGPRGCFLHVTMENEARVSYLEIVISAKAVEIYVLKGGQGASGDYVYVGKVDGRPAVDHPFKYHYKFGTSDLPDTRVALIQLRLTPHQEGTTEVYIFRFSVLVGDANARHKSNIASSMSMATNSMSAGGSIAHLPGAPGSSSNTTTTSMVEYGGAGGVVATRNQAHEMTTGATGSGGEAAVVADALNDVMGKMLTVVTKKTKGYVGSTYKKTEDKIQARMRSMEEKIQGFEKVVGQNLERRLLDLEHVMDTLNAKIQSPNSSRTAPPAHGVEESKEALPPSPRRQSSSLSSSSSRTEAV